jgi:hypothetical protein
MNRETGVENPRNTATLRLGAMTRLEQLKGKELR